jgi:hypothetical protein
MGRGVNMDDLFLCGYDSTLWLEQAETYLHASITGLMSDWKPNFVRVSLSMNSYIAISWTVDVTKYTTPMTNLINAIGQNPNVYVLVALRSDPSMIDLDQADIAPDGTGIPSDAASTPDAQAFPTGTDATYVALVDTFAQSPFVMFGVSNEPGGNALGSESIAKAMSHAVDVIRAEEDRLGVTHHIIAVQGNASSSDISFYDQSPLLQDNIVYEVHGASPAPESYTYSHIPVIIGAYGTLAADASASFYADVEAKQIPNLASIFEPFTDCPSDLVQTQATPSPLMPTDWGNVVQGYLLQHTQ